MTAPPRHFASSCAVLNASAVRSSCASFFEADASSVSSAQTSKSRPAKQAPNSCRSPRWAPKNKKSPWKKKQLDGIGLFAEGGVYQI